MLMEHWIYLGFQCIKRASDTAVVHDTGYYFVMCSSAKLTKGGCARGSYLQVEAQCPNLNS